MGNAAIVVLVLLALIWLAVRAILKARDAELERQRAVSQRQMTQAEIDADLWRSYAFARPSSVRSRAAESQEDRRRRESRASSGPHCPTQPHTQMTYGATDSGCSGGSSDSGGSCSSD